MSLFYTMEKVDKASGAVGSFIHAGDFKAISPCFPNLVMFYNWLNDSPYDTDFAPFSIKMRDKTWTRDLALFHRPSLKVVSNNFQIDAKIAGYYNGGVEVPDDNMKSALVEFEADGKRIEKAVAWRTVLKHLNSGEMIFV